MRIIILRNKVNFLILELGDNPYTLRTSPVLLFCWPLASALCQYIFPQFENKPTPPWSEATLSPLLSFYGANSQIYLFTLQPLIDVYVYLLLHLIFIQIRVS